MSDRPAEVLARDDVALDVRDAAIVDEHDEKTDGDVDEHDAVAQIGQYPDGRGERVERHQTEGHETVQHDRH